MVDDIQNEGIEYPMERINVEPDFVLNKNLEDFISNYTRRFFTIIKIRLNF